MICPIDSISISLNKRVIKINTDKPMIISAFPILFLSFPLFQYDCISILVNLFIRFILQFWIDFTEIPRIENILFRAMQFFLQIHFPPSRPIHPDKLVSSKSSPFTSVPNGILSQESAPHPPPGQTFNHGCRMKRIPASLRLLSLPFSLYS